MVIDCQWNSISDVGHASSGTASAEFRGTKRDHVQLSSLDVYTSAAAADSNDSFIAAPPQRSNKIDVPRWEDDSSSDEGTNSFRRRYKRAKNTGAYIGWLSTSTLKVVAERYRGTASQFRVVRGVSAFHNSTTQGSIPPGSLIVQSRFVSPTGNVRGQTSMFLNWKLPGKINRRSHYKDTRPWFHDAGTPLNAYPSVTLESDLHPAVKTIVSTFLREAKPGTTPIEFFGNGDDPELFALFRDHCYLPPGKSDPWDRMHAAARNEAAHSGTWGDDATLIFDTISQGTTELQNLEESIRDTDNDEGAGPFDDDITCPEVGRAHGAAANDGPNLLDGGEDNKKGSGFPFISCQLSARNKRKCSQGPRPRNPIVLVGGDDKGWVVGVDGKIQHRSHAASQVETHSLRPVAVVLNPKAPRCSQPADKTCATACGPKTSASNIERFTNDVDEISTVHKQHGLLDGSSAPIQDTAAFLFPNLGSMEEKGGHVIPAEIAFKDNRAGRPPTVTPGASMRKNYGLAIETQSPLPPKGATLAMLPLVTPCVDRVLQTSKCTLRPQSIVQPCNEDAKTAMSNDDDIGEIRLCIYDNTTSCERYDPVVVRDPGNPMRSKPHWNWSGYVLFAVSLLVFCLRIPEHLPDSPRGRSVVAEKQGSFDDLLEEQDAFQAPMGYSIVGSEIVSVGAAVLVAVMFGSA